MRLTEHFQLEEFGSGLRPNDFPTGVIENIDRLCSHVLEPARKALGVPIRITSGYRPRAHNAEVGGVQGSDHERGMAADCQCAAGHGFTWEQNTIRLAGWIRQHLDGRFGQLILEDHREHLNNPWKLWVHVSLPTTKHPGDHDPNRLLLSLAPKQYQPLGDEHLA